MGDAEQKMNAWARPTHADGSAPPAFAVGILNYRTKDLLVENLEGCLRSGIPSGRLVVWDNASGDGSVEAVAARFPNVRCVSSERNLGYAGGMNALVESLPSKRVVLVTADCFVTLDLVNALIAALDADSATALAGCRIVDRRTGRIQSEGGDITFPTGIPLARSWQREVSAAGSGHIAEASYLDGAVLAVDRESFRALGGFDPTYFAYQEDVDLCWRARMRARRVVCVGTVAAVHATSASFRGNAALRWTLTERNRMANNLKNLGMARLTIAVLYEGLYGVAVMVGASRLGMPGYRRAYAAGLLALFRDLRDVLRERKAVQAGRTVPDRTLLAAHPKMGLSELAKALSERAALAREFQE